MGAETIIIIDDDKPFLEALSLLLRDYGYQVQQALNGQAGIVKSLQQQPDLVIIDVHLPDINGVDVAQQIRRSHTSTPLIMISSDDSREIVSRCRAIDSCMFVSKSLASGKLITAIADLLDSRNTPR